MTYEQAQKDIRNWSLSVYVSAVLLFIAAVLIGVTMFVPGSRAELLAFVVMFFGWWWNRYYVEAYGEIAKASVEEYGKPELERLT